MVICQILLETPLRYINNDHWCGVKTMHLTPQMGIPAVARVPANACVEFSQTCLTVSRVYNHIPTYLCTHRRIFQSFVLRYLSLVIQLLLPVILDRLYLILSFTELPSGLASMSETRNLSGLCVSRGTWQTSHHPWHLSWKAMQLFAEALWWVYGCQPRTLNQPATHQHRNWLMLRMSINMAL